MLVPSTPHELLWASDKLPQPKMAPFLDSRELSADQPVSAAMAFV